MVQKGTIAKLLEIGMPEGFKDLHDITKEIAKLTHQVKIAEQKNEALQMCYTNGSESQLQHMLGEAQDPLVEAVKASAEAANPYEAARIYSSVSNDYCQKRPSCQHARLDLDARAMDLKNEIQKVKLKIQLAELKDRLDQLHRSSQSQAPMMIVGAYCSRSKRCAVEPVGARLLSWASDAPDKRNINTPGMQLQGTKRPFDGAHSRSSQSQAPIIAPPIGTYCYGSSLRKTKRRCEVLQVEPRFQSREGDMPDIPIPASASTGTACGWQDQLPIGTSRTRT